MKIRLTFENGETTETEISGEHTLEELYDYYVDYNLNFSDKVAKIIKVEII